MKRLSYPLACLALATTLVAHQGTTPEWEPTFTNEFAAPNSGPDDSTPEIAHPSEGLMGFYTDAPSYLPDETVHVLGNWGPGGGGG
ncbi:MAG: hypothetical protein WD226_03990, partial [Planctomycetota bacterium]